MSRLPRKPGGRGGRKTGECGVCLLGPYGSGNLGDAAIQDAMMAGLRKHVPGVVFCGISHNPADTAWRHGIEAFPIGRSTAAIPGRRTGAVRDGPLRRLAGRVRSVPGVEAVWRRLSGIAAEGRHLAGALALLKRMELLVFSGGGQLDDFWGGAFGLPFLHFKWSVLATLAGTRIAYVSVGADSIRSPLSRLFFLASLRRADYVSFRDAGTARLVRAMGYRAAGAVFPDLAYSLPVPPSMLAGDPGGAGSPTIGVSPIAASAYTDREDPVHAAYLDGLARLVDWLIRKGFRVCFFPSQVKMDAPVIEHTIAKLRGMGMPPDSDRILRPSVRTLDDLLSAIASTDVVVASRMHACLLAHLLRKPVLAFSPSRKVDTLMNDMGFGEYCLDIRKGVGIETVGPILMKLLAERPSIAARVDARVKQYASRLEEQYGFLAGLLDRDEDVGGLNGATSKA